MRVALVALLVLACSGAARAQDISTRVEIFIIDGGHPKKVEWRDPSLSNEAEILAVKEFREILAKDVGVRATLTDALRRLDAFRNEPFFLGGGELGAQGVENRWPMNENGKVALVLDMSESAFGGNAHMSHREVSNPNFANGKELQAYVKMSAGKLQGLSSIERARSYMREVLAHELGHVNLMFAEAEAVAKLRLKQTSRIPLIFSSQGKHSFRSITTKEAALLEGLAEATQLQFYFEETYLKSSYVAGIENGTLWASYRERIPIHKRIILRLAELSNAEPGTLRQRLGTWVLEKYGPSFEDPTLHDAKGDGREMQLKTLDTMLKTEGVVALTLYDLYKAKLTSFEEVHDVISLGGVDGLDTLVKKLKETKAPEAAKAIDAVVSRRLLGADIDHGRASQLFERLQKGTMLPAEFRAALEELIASKHGKEFTLTGVPAGGEVGARASRIRRLMRQFTAPHFWKGQAQFALALAASNALVLWMNGDGKVGINEILEDAQKKLVSKEFAGSMALFTVTSHLLDDALDSTVSDVTKAAADKLKLAERINKFGGGSGEAAASALSKEAAAASRTAGRLNAASAIHKGLGGPITMIAAGIIIRQLVAHDWSFFNCDIPLDDKVLQTLKLIATEWTLTTSAAIDLIAGAAGFGAVMGTVALTVGPPTGFVGSAVVMGVGLLASLAATALVQPAIHKLEQVEYQHIKDSIRFILDEYKKEDAAANPGLLSFTWLWMESKDKDAIKSTTSVGDKRKALAKALGTIEEKELSKYECARGKAGDKIKVIGAGTMKEFLARRENELGKAVGEMHGALEDKQKRLDEAQLAFAKASTPLGNGLDVKRFTLLLCIDRSGKLVPPNELADQLVIGSLMHPEIAKALNVQVKDDVSLAGLSERFEKEIRQMFETTEFDELRRQHNGEAVQFRVAQKEAKDNFDSVNKEFNALLKEKGGKLLETVKKAIEEDAKEFQAFDFTPLKEDAGDLLEYLENRRKAVDKAQKAYEQMLVGHKQGFENVN